MTTSPDSHLTSRIDKARVQSSVARGLYLSIREPLTRTAHFVRSRFSAGDSLVSEDIAYDAFRKVMGSPDGNYKDSKHFFRVANRAMVQVVLDYHRKRNRNRELPLSGADICDPFSISCHEEETIQDALEALAEHDRQWAGIVRDHYLAGVPLNSIANVLGLTDDQVQYRHRLALNWLLAYLLRDRNE